MGVNMIVYQVVNEFKRLSEVLAITLSGSGANDKNKFYSDIDIDIIVEDDIADKGRMKILSKFSDEIHSDLGRYGEIDKFVLRNSTTQIEISYIKLKVLKENLESIVDNYQAFIGYTTCLWRNVINAYVAYDKNMIFKELQKKYNRQYPNELKKNIIQKNYEILKKEENSYYNQIKSALKSQSRVDITHKIDNFLESYFDIIFAINEIPHPGERKVLTFIDNRCKYKPIDIIEDVTNLIESSTIYDGNVLKNMEYLIEHLNELLQKENLLPC